MAEKKERSFIKASDQNSTPRTMPTTKTERREKATGKRIAAVCFWVLGIACEVVAILLLNQTIYPGEGYIMGLSKQLFWMLIALIADLIFVIIGSQFWKRANDVDPASEQNKVKFWLWNQMGLIVSCIAFFPIIIVLLRNKDLDEKTRKVATAVAAVALLISGLASYDWNPISAEQRDAMELEYQGTTVYYTTFGKKYHIDQDCPTIINSSNVYYGTIDEAIDAGRTAPCKVCTDKDH